MFPFSEKTRRPALRLKMIPGCGFKPKLSMSGGRERGGGSHLGFTISMPTVFTTIWSRLADTSASGNHNKVVSVASKFFDSPSSKLYFKK